MPGVMRLTPAQNAAQAAAAVAAALRVASCEALATLPATVTARLSRDPLSGDLFVFRNRRGDRLKILAWQGDGFALYVRRLERGTFAFPTAGKREPHATAREPPRG